jgi:HD-GYP domain-containing protein (c-di-GMP phosphodiesterase class II)
MISVIRECGGKDYVRNIKPFAKNKDSKICIEALKTLVHFGDREGPAYLKAYLKGDDPELKEQVANLSGSYRIRDTVPCLIEILEKKDIYGSDPLEKLPAIRALAKIGDPQDAVLGFVSAMKREANVLRMVSPVKTYSDHTYVHTSNVAVLTLFQAESLDMKGESLREAGLAGLLHDVGKMFVSKDVLDKPGKLDEAEWKEMKRHPVYGAMHLCRLEDPPRLAVIASYEHHLKFDGSGYPGTKRHAKKQHIISQIVALSDFFDALRSERPYRKAFELSPLLDLIKGSAGKDFNPLLVDNFISALKRTGVFQS